MAALLIRVADPSSDLLIFILLFPTSFSDDIRGLHMLILAKKKKKKKKCRIQKEIEVNFRAHRVHIQKTTNNKETLFLSKNFLYHYPSLDVSQEHQEKE